MAAFDEDDDVINLCSYPLTGPNLTYQAIYICGTCTSVSNACCCSGCAETCHNGHDVSFLAYGRSFCDCGANFCSNAIKSVNPAKFICRYNDPSITFDRIQQFNDFDRCGFKEFLISSKEDAVFSLLRTDSCQLVRQSKDTFWVDDSFEPRCSLEGFVRNIYEYHKKNLPEDIMSSGAEWWVQAKDITLTNNITSAIDLHYDKDEEVAELFTVGLFPWMSTVTYLTNTSPNASPTIIFDNKSYDPVSKEIKDCILSWPIVGKHICFDGRNLHGAPSEPALRNIYSALETQPVDDVSTSMRVTLVVNIWINHHPSGADKLPENLLHQFTAFSPSPTSANGAFSNPIYTVTVMPEPIVLVLDTEVVEAGLVPANASGTSTVNPKNIPEVDEEEEYDEGEAGAKKEILNLNGKWVTLPFVSDSSIWGKDVDETGLVMNMWVPSPHLVASKQLQKQYNNNSDEGTIFSTLHLRYDDIYAASLVYEEEGEGKWEGVDGELASETATCMDIK